MEARLYGRWDAQRRVWIVEVSQDWIEHQGPLLRDQDPVALLPKVMLHVARDIMKPRPAVIAAREQVRKNNLRRFPWLRVKS